MRGILCTLVVVCLLTRSIRADDWTPFYDRVFEVGKTYEKTASVAWLGGEKYLLLVKSDTAQTFVVYARAKEGTVTAKQLGDNRLVKAKIVSREKDPSGRGERVEVEIVEVK